MSKAVNLGEKIKSARAALKLTQEQLAKACRVSRPAVAQWEKNTTTPSAINLYSISQATQLPLAFFFSQAPATVKTNVAQTSWLPQVAYSELNHFLNSANNSKSLKNTLLLPCPTTTHEGAFALVLNDNRYVPLFLAQDYLCIDPLSHLEANDTVLVKIEKEHFALCHYESEDKKLVFIDTSESKNAVHLDKLSRQSIIGIVVFTGRNRHLIN